MTKVTLGGDRIGSGNKQKVELHNYGMNSFNLEQDWKSSMAPGILYPFLKLVGTNHGTFDIDLDSFVRTLPTTGPLFGSFKLQLDIYSVPIRLYQGILHNNPVGIGLKMNQVYLPKLRYKTVDGVNAPRAEGADDYNFQVNESSLLKYIGLSGIGRKTLAPTTTGQIMRKINAIPILAYYDIFKNYYSNKQEENAYVITPKEVTQTSIQLNGLLFAYPNTEPTVTRLNIPYNGDEISVGTISDRTKPMEFTFLYRVDFKDYSTFELTQEIKQKIVEEQGLTIYFTSGDEELSIEQPIIDWINDYTTGQKWKLNNNPDGTKTIQFEFTIYDLDEYFTKYIASVNAINFKYYTSEINLTPFALANIDDMRNVLLSSNTLGDEVVLGDEISDTWTSESGTDGTGLPYSALFKQTEEGISWNAFAQNGLLVKTYQSDLFNNWLETEFIDGENGIASISAVDTSEGKFTMDSLNLAEKIYELLNRVLVSGGTYEDWQEAVYGEGAVRKAETPMYIGGMSAEIMFEEVVASTAMEVADDSQALGSLGGKGTQVGSKGGHNIHVKCDEPSYIIGIASLTPRICYSQGNDWDLTDLNTLDDLHKPALDGIGFQDLMVEQFAWWSTGASIGGSVIRQAAGKQTAWINYQTAVDKCFGDFAKTKGKAFMVLNRNYEMDLEDSVTTVKDITTYIDPAKFNYAFTYSQLDAQNFWVQIHSKVIARRKMGAQQIPNL